MPPPTEYPLRPRPRASEYIHQFACWRGSKRPASVLPHSIPGPPHSLIVVDQPGTSNAFSYGFGPSGAGGIVVYSGFLDDVLATTPMAVPTAGSVDDQPWFSWLFGGLFSRPRPTSLRPTPTPEQTSELAILLAHELSHLVLAHHLESLSSATVIVPGTISILTDFVRVLLFPVTMIFGPFVNDALAQLGKMGSVELSKAGAYCTNNVIQEIEADIVSARSVNRRLSFCASLKHLFVDSWRMQDLTPGRQLNSGKFGLPPYQSAHLSILVPDMFQGPLSGESWVLPTLSMKPG